MKRTFGSRYQTSRSAGFSLVELLVSLALFTIVTTVGISTLLVLINANAKAQYMQETMTNLTFVLDSVTREIRTGHGYYCANSLPSSISESETLDCTERTGLSIVEGGSSLTAGSGSARIAYRFQNGGIERRVGTGDWLQLTSDAVTITDMHFTVRGADTYTENGDVAPATVTIYIEGEAGSREEIDTSFSMQTTVTHRTLDI